MMTYDDRFMMIRLLHCGVVGFLVAENTSFGCLAA